MRQPTKFRNNKWKRAFIYKMLSGEKKNTFEQWNINWTKKKQREKQTENASVLMFKDNYDFNVSHPKTTVLYTYKNFDMFHRIDLCTSHAYVYNYSIRTITSTPKLNLIFGCTNSCLRIKQP